MERTLLDMIRLMLPLSRSKKGHVSMLKPFLPDEELSKISYYLKLGWIGVSYARFGIDKFITEEAYPQVHPSKEDKELSKLTAQWNKIVEDAARLIAFEEFSKVADQKIPSLIAPHIVGFDDVKLAATWQLFCPERVHLLLLGDPGTGKTEILRGAARFAPISSFGLGSGTSGVGLVAAKKGDALVKGLLPLAHKGLCCIDELNLMKVRDRGALLNAMEKGFVTYDKGTTHKKLPAEVRVLATANPKGDRFIGDKVSFLKKQLPFDPALLSRFHLIFLTRKPDVQAFLKIAKSIVNDDKQTLKDIEIEFIKDYIDHASKQNVAFDKKLEPVITDFFEDLKGREKDMLIELSPRLVVGVVRLSKAVARMNLRSVVTHKDLSAVLSVIHSSTQITLDAESKKNS